MDVKKMDNKPNNIYEVEEVTNRKLYGTDMNYRHKYIWFKVVLVSILHVLWLIGFYTLIFYTKLATMIWAFYIGFCASHSITLGAHRAYSHNSFKLAIPLKLYFLFFQTVAGQQSMFTWAKYHRIHHKYSETDADPHNANRGFFFSHVGWILSEKHPLVIEKWRQIDVSDMMADKMLMFQYKYYAYLYVPITVLFPTLVPMYFWNETLWSSFFVAYCFQHVSILHTAFIVSSGAHLWNDKPYDRRIGASDSIFCWFITFGEGWHNFHHTFPWDARQSEYGRMGGINSWLLELFAYLGLAYDLKSVSPNVVFRHMRRHGDERGQKILSKRERIEAQKNNSQLKDIYVKVK